MQLSQHFSLEEMIASQYAARHGIDNTPPLSIIECLKSTCGQLEGVRALFGHPLLISSGYRSPALNAALGGVPNSAHVEGHAADFICPDAGTPVELCGRIVASGIRYDQLIQEGTWVHISFAPTYRQQALTAIFGPNGATYSAGAA